MLEEIKMQIDPTLDAVVKWCDAEHTVFYHELNDLGRELADHKSETAKMAKKLIRKCRFTKLALIAAVTAGVIYAIKNEADKDELRTKIIDLHKQQEVDAILGSEATIINEHINE